MKIELLRCLLDKGTIADDTVILIEMPYVKDGATFMMTYGVAGAAIEHDHLGKGVKLILKATKCIPALLENITTDKE